MLESLKTYIYIIVLAIIPSFCLCQQDNVHNLQNPVTIKNVDFSHYTNNDNYIFFEKSSPLSNSGRLIINISTQNQENISVSWQNSFGKKTKTKWFIKMQYRLSETEDWKDIKDNKGRNTEFVTTQKRYVRNFDNIILPEECNDKDFVQISWIVDTYTKNKTNYPDIYFRNLNIFSEYDPFAGTPAIIQIYKPNDETKKEINGIVFNKIPLPYIYPETKRIVIEGTNIRDSITLQITGTDASCFALSQQSVDSKYPSKTIIISYIPKKEGKHHAQLEINTYKIKDKIIISLDGACAKNNSYEENLLPQTENNSDKTIVLNSEVSYHIPVFSNTDYQYKFSQNNNNVQNIRIKYKWYRDNVLLFAMYDTVKRNEYCVPLKSPSGATALDIELSASNNIVLDSYYFGSPKVKTMIKSGVWDDENNWEPKGMPNVEDFVVIDKGVKATVTHDAMCNTLILNDSANVNINTGKTFYVSNNIFYNKGAWFTVHQYLLPSRWNYISSPVNQARAAVFSMKNRNSDNDTWFMQYNTGKRSKLDDYWSDYITDPQFTLLPGRGYAVYTHDAMDVKYEGLLCNSSTTIPLISTQEDRWNLVGNPYTAPLSSKKLFEDIDGRIQGNVIMLFDRETKVYNPLIIDPKEEVMIPSLESFFVEATDTPSEITFRRTHQYIPKTSSQVWTNNNYLNFSVSKGKYSQYILLGMEDKSSYGFDQYDCHKMFGNNEDMPDIYLKYNDDEFAVNVFPNYPAIYDIGLYIGNPSDVEINMNNLSIMPEYVQIFIEDKTSNDFHNVCDENSLKIHLNNGTTENYRLHILKSIKIKESKFEESGFFIWKDNGRILCYNKGFNKVEKLRITKNNNIVTEETITDNEVLVRNINKGKYKISLLINGKWSEEINFEM